jgi:lipid II:glycine glycyltransferase (peptidoglycan interpeptide bridge formation enzyme)
LIQTFHPFSDPDIIDILLKNKRILKAYKFPESKILVFQLKLPFFKKGYSFLITTNLTQKVKNQLPILAKKHQAIFAILEPNQFEILKDQKQNPPKEPFKSLVPIQTTVLDLNLSQDELLKNMHSKTRYNIKVAKKHNIKVQKSENIKDFYKILKLTSTRDNFAINSEKYIQSFYENLKKKNKAQLFMAFKDQTPVAGLICTYHKQTAIYYYGASDHQYRKFMAPYLLQWEAICDAKAQDFHTYDFLGVTTSKDPKHQLSGVSQFKLKFNGPVLNFQDRQTLVYKPFLFLLLKLKKSLKRFF